MFHRWLLLAALAILLAGCNQEPPPPKLAPPRAPTASGSSRAAATTAQAPLAKPARSAQATQARRAQPLLWELKKDGKLVAHIFGTLHLGVDPKAELNPVVWQRFAKATTFVMEAVPTAIVPDLMKKWATLPPSQSLKDKLKQENWRKVTTRLGTSLMGLPMERMRPWLVFASLTRTLAPTGANTMDQHFLAQAKSSKKQLAFLEKVADQLQLLDRAITSRVLDDMLSDLRRARVMVHDLIKAYRNGNFTALEKAVFDPTEVAKHREMYRLMFDKRNQAWLPQIEKHAAKGNAFIAFGAGHLAGEKGLLRLLHKRGYQLTRVKPVAPSSQPAAPKR